MQLLVCICRCGHIGLHWLTAVPPALQLVARIACSTIADAEVLDLTVRDVCVTIPSYSSEAVCGWEALQVNSFCAGMAARTQDCAM